MDEGGYFPAPMEGVIMAKGFPDLALIEKCHKSRRDGVSKRTVFPGSEDKQNFAIKPHELFIGYKNQNNNYSNDRSAVLGVTAVPGLEFTDTDPEVLMSKFVFFGVPSDEWYYQGESMYNTDSLDHGFGLIIHGKCTINNTWHSDITAADYVAWRLPPTQSGDPGTKKTDMRRTIDNGLNPMINRNRAGTPFGKPVWQLEKYDPLDFTFQLSGTFWALDKTMDAGGILDMSKTDYDTNKNNYTMVQQEAFCWAYGIRSLMLHTMITIKESGFLGLTQGNVDDTFVNAQKNALGLVDGKLNNSLVQILRRVFRDNCIPGSEVSYNGNTSSATEILDNTMSMLTGGTCIAMMSKMSRIIGKAVSSAGPGKSLDVVLTGARLGI
jgi:hypothetical protein